jgi:glycosyltransferase involved in cell wall biosynthesis
LKVIHVNQSDINGGAARAAFRLHRALLTAGVSSTMLVQSKQSDDLTVFGGITNIEKLAAFFRPFIDAIPTFFYPRKTVAPFSVGWQPSGRLINQINKSDADLVHLHWICGGMLDINRLLSIKKPLVWSMHDMWPFTGGCHYDGDCERYTQQCGLCDVLGSKKNYDLSSFMFNSKRKVLLNSKNITLVGLSSWISKCAQKSKVFAGKRVVVIPNLIDTKQFSPIERTIARNILGLPLHKKLIAFGAVKSTSDMRKGYSFLIDALRHLNGEDNSELLVFGASSSEYTQSCPYKTSYFGYLHDDVTLRLLYSAADVMVVPSLQENLSNAIMESMACGTPVVGFSVGGNGDLIDHKLNGYLATPFDSQDLAQGISWILESADYGNLSTSAREKIVCCFDSKVVSAQYIKLYQQLLSNVK